MELMAGLRKSIETVGQVGRVMPVDDGQGETQALFWEEVMGVQPEQGVLQEIPGHATLKIWIRLVRCHTHSHFTITFQHKLAIR
jgi:hypothetical protein